MRRRVTRRLTRLQTMYKVLKYAKNDEIKTKNQITSTATEPHRNRKFRQFNKDPCDTLSQYQFESNTVAYENNIFDTRKRSSINV